MAVDRAGRDLEIIHELGTEHEEFQSAGIAATRAGDHDVRQDVVAPRPIRYRLQRVVVTVLFEFRGREDLGIIRRNQIEIIVIVGGSEPIIPLERNLQFLVGQDPDQAPEIAGPEVVHVIQPLAHDGGRAEPGEIRFVVLFGLIARGGHKENAIRHRVLRRVRHVPILEVRLFREPEIVHDDLAAEILKLADRLDELLGRIARRESQRGSGRQVMDDLEHRGAFVLGRAGRPDLDVVGQVAGPDRILRGLNAVRDHPDLHPGAPVTLGAHVRRLMDRVAFR